LFGRKELANCGDDEALAGGSALVGASVFVSVEAAVDSKDSDGGVADVDD
jgi:hypothetical protein